jgi:hypothetical protein
VAVVVAQVKPEPRQPTALEKPEKVATGRAVVLLEQQQREPVVVVVLVITTGQAQKATAVLAVVVMVKNDQTMTAV